MKVSAQPIRAVAPALSRAPGPSERLPVQAGLVALAPGVSCLFVDDASASGRLAPETGEAPLPRPLVVSALPLSNGGLRHIVLVGEDASRTVQRRLDLVGAGRSIARLDPDWLQSPLRAVADLTGGLAPGGRRTLAKLALTCGATLFAGPGCRPGLLELLGLLGVPTLGPAAWRPIGSRAGLLSVAAKAGLIGELDAMLLLAGGRARALPRDEAFVERGERADLLHLPLPARPREDALLAVLAPDPFLLAVPDGAPRALLPWLDRRSRPFSRWLYPRLEAAAREDETAAGILAEIESGIPETPAATVVAIARTRSGVLLAAETHEAPATLRVAVEDRVREIAISAGQITTAAFVTFTGPMGSREAVRVSLHLRSGRSALLHDGAVPLFSGALLPAFRGLHVPLVAPAIASALLDTGRAFGPVQVEAFGEPSASPRLAVVARLGSAEETARALYAGLHAEPSVRRVELVVTAPCEQAGAARRILRECHGIFGIAARLIITSPGLSESGRLAAALRAVQSPRALLLGADVLPRGAGWLAPWLRADPRALSGATLLAPDGSVLHAGGTLQGAAEQRLSLRAEGLPERDLPLQPRAATALLTADCAALGRPAIEAFVAQAARCPDPDVLLSFLAAQTPGRVQTRLDARFVCYRGADAEAELRNAVRAHALGALLAGEEEERPCAS